MAFKFDGVAEHRPNGLLEPPENPFLRDDMRPKVVSHLARRRQQQQEQAAASASAAATAAAGEGPRGGPVAAAAVVEPRPWWSWGHAKE